MARWGWLAVLCGVPWLAAPALAQAPGGCPAGYVEMTVQGVVPTEQGMAVVLKPDKEEVLLPIWIGEAEAFSIRLRLERRRFERPLTHDLLDTVVRELGGKLIKIHVDDLKGNTFVGMVFIQQGKKTISIDSRPSDAIALAVGNRLPICVSQKVFERAGIRKEAPEPESPQKSPKDTPENLLKDIIDPAEEKTL
ncbi:MAG: bifunctional nuclease family protein [Myxococcales bacterium]|nr:bifunctional nuclease family protein [Myxococcales bacterium]